MSIQGNWAGDYQGEWFGSAGGPGPDYKLAALTVTGTGVVTMAALVRNPAPALGPVGGGWVDYRKKIKKIEEEVQLTQTGHLLIPSKEDVSTAIALVHARKARHNTVLQQRKDEEELLLMF